MKKVYFMCSLFLVPILLHAQFKPALDKKIFLDQNIWSSKQMLTNEIDRYSDLVSNPNRTSFPDTIKSYVSDTTKDSVKDTIKYNMYGDLLNDDPLYNKRASLWSPLLRIEIQNVLLNLADHYIMQYEWAVVGFNSWNRTFVKSGFPWNDGWKWDIDRFGNNFLLHPYTGGSYYNAARSSGYNFWESSAFTFGGAYLYKLFGENGWPNGKPERNDLIATTLGGMYLGEILYRLGSNVIDERTSGLERVGREAVAFVISPGRTISRFFNGKLFSHIDKEVYQTEPLNITLSMGYHRVNDGIAIEKGSNSTNINLILDYGNPFEKRSRKPFDYFRVRTDFDFGVGRKIVDNITGYGNLYATNVQIGNLEMLTGLFQHMNYFDNKTFELGTFGFGYGIISKLPMSKSTSLYTNLHLNIVPFGALSGRFGPDTSQVRDYDFAGGAEAKLESTFNFGGWVNLTFIGYYWWMHTYAGVAGNSYIALIKPRITFKIFNNVSLGFEHLIYYSDRYPRDFPSVHSVRTEQKIFVQIFFEEFKFKK